MNFSNFQLADGSALAMSLYLENGFCVFQPQGQAPSDMAAQPYSVSRVCLAGTALLAGVSLCAEGIKLMWTMPETEPFSVQRNRSVRALTYIYSGVVLATGSVFLMRILQNP